MQSKQFVYKIFFLLLCARQKTIGQQRAPNSNLGDAKLQKIAQKLQQKKRAAKSVQNYRNAYNR